ncbi:energy transducer TonB [Rhodocyclus tenuis]|uniref:energy transducer TonB n=1 Tax=Rhodocyclus tenuis TaxID=1066 RepID=UPI001908AC7B|nr:energy transducer TonB [Rhodocyclus tenuis]MBK1680957.1 hypothetical protein [Rhodocyclus tenuis]
MKPLSFSPARHAPPAAKANTSGWQDGLPALLLVALAHAALLAAVLIGLRAPAPDPVVLPTLSGVLVAAPAEQLSVPVPAPEPKPQREPQARRPPPPVHAPPSERSITVPQAEPETNRPQQENTAALATPTANSEAAATAPVLPPMADASHLNNPAPVYPMSCRRRGEQGTVLLTVLVLADGTVGDIGIRRSSGYPDLDESALKAVSRWRFVPASRGGKPLDWRYSLPVIFNLRQ